MGFALSGMKLSSTAFKGHGPIPKKHTGEGEDVSPAMAWSDAPDGAGSFALVCHDPDAPLILPGAYGFVHWVIYNIPGSVHELAEGVDAYTVGINNFGKPGYGGPMPPEGHGTHHYYFWLIAIRAVRQYEAGLSMWELLEQVEPDVLGMNRLVGTYRRG